MSEERVLFWIYLVLAGLLVLWAVCDHVAYG